MKVFETQFSKANLMTKNVKLETSWQPVHLSTTGVQTLESDRKFPCLRRPNVVSLKCRLKPSTDARHDCNRQADLFYFRPRTHTRTHTSARFTAYKPCSGATRPSTRPPMDASIYPSFVAFRSFLPTYK